MAQQPRAERDTYFQVSWINGLAPTPGSQFGAPPPESGTTDKAWFTNKTDAEEWDRHIKTRPRRALEVVPPFRIPVGDS